MDSLSKGLVLKGMFASQALDKSAEVLDIKNLDISGIEKGNAIANFEHQNNPQNIVGRILSAHKVFSENDCRDELELKMFKNGGKLPAVIGSVELFDDHPEANALSKMILHYKKSGLPPNVGFSIEGGILERDGNLLKRAVARGVALTMKPCNAACQAELIGQLSKSEAEVINKFEQVKPSHVIGTSEVDIEVVETAKITSSIQKLQNSLADLTKALGAGFAVGPAGSLTGGEALQKPKTDKKVHVVATPPDETTTGTHTETTPVVFSDSKAKEESGLKDISSKVDKLEDKAKEVKLKLKKSQILANQVALSLKK